MGDILHGLRARREARKAAVIASQAPAVVESMDAHIEPVVTSQAILSDGPQFDPSAHTVAEVLTFIEEHPDTADAVLAAERDGKARKSLIG